jgi:hypothetical protein
MSTPTIPAGNLFMNATTYTGTGAAATITNGAAGQAFQPDLVWLKCLNINPTNHYLTDSVRGTTSQLYSNSTALQGSSGNVLTAFNSNGFSLGTDAEINGSTRTYVGWNWKAGGTAVTNTAGNITSQVSANTTSGFSVVTYTGTGTAGRNVGHGLGVVPKMIIVKQRGTSGTSWAVYNANLPSAFGVAGTQVMYLDSTTNNTQNFDVWDSNNPTSAFFSVGASTLSNASTGTYVAYCWAEIAGYSAFGSYTGNGDPNGPFIYTGFRPRWIMFKMSSSSGNGWIMYDTSRNTYNVAGASLYANYSTAENGTSLSNENTVDLLSNGFKLRTTNASNNTSGATYIYACFAENPFKYANAR